MAAHPMLALAARPHALSEAAARHLKSWTRIAVIFVLPWFVFVPFIEIPGLPLSLDDLLPVAVVAAGLLIRMMGGRPRFEPVVLGLVLIATINLLASLYAGGSDYELLRSAARGFGRFLFYAALVVIVVSVVRDRRDVERILWCFVIAAVVQSLFCLWAYAVDFHGPYGLGMAPTPIWSSLRRVHGTFASGVSSTGGSPVSANFLSAYLMCAAVLAGGFAVRRGSWLSCGASLWALAICVAAIGLSYTRSSLVGVTVGLTLTALLSRRYWLMAVAVSASLASLFFVPGLGERMGSVESNRPALYIAGFRIVEDHPLLGVGDGNYQRVLRASERYQMTSEGPAVATPHNSILLATAHAGPVAGFLLFLVVLVVIARLLLLSFWIRDPDTRALAAALAGAAVAFWIQDQSNSLLFVPKTATWFWVFAALALVLGRGVTPFLQRRAGSPPLPQPSSR